MSYSFFEVNSLFDKISDIMKKEMAAARQVEEAEDTETREGYEHKTHKYWEDYEEGYQKEAEDERQQEGEALGQSRAELRKWQDGLTVEQIATELKIRHGQEYKKEHVMQALRKNEHLVVSRPHPEFPERPDMRQVMLREHMTLEHQQRGFEPGIGGLGEAA